MAEVLIVLIVLGIVLTMATLVGHGIWVLMTTLFGRGKKAPQRTCAFCGQLTRENDSHRCEWCGRDLRSPMAVELDDIEAVQRQLRRFLRKGTLAPEVADDMLKRLERYRQALVRGQPLPQAEPAGLPPRRTARPVATAAPAVPVAKPLPSSKQPSPPAPLPQVGEGSTAREPAELPTLPLAPVQPPAPVVQPPAAVVPPSAPVVQPPAALVQPPAPVAQRPAAVVQPPAPVVQQPAAVAPRPAPLVAPKPPRRAWSEILAAFMEERNIRWGEVVGGLLMVGSSIALVLSLWSTLQEIRYFPFLLFVAVTSAVFGVGLYSHHRWKLESTSRGLLIIATLLVPLNFLAMASLSRLDWDWITLAIELGALGVFAWLTALAGAVIAPKTRWLQSLGVVGNSAALLAISRLVGPEPSAAREFMAAAVPSIIFAVAVGGAIAKLAGRGRMKLPDAAELFTLLGVASFALVAAHGMMVAQSGFVAITLYRLSPLVAFGAAVGLFAALSVAHGTRRREKGDRHLAATDSSASQPTTARSQSPFSTRRLSEDLAAWHMGATTVALVTAAIMLGAVALAWPHPLGMIVVGAIDAAALAWAAFRWRTPVLHAAAMACATVVYLCLFHAIYNSDRVPWLLGPDDSPLELLRLLLDSSSGTALVGLFAVFGVVSEALSRRGRRVHAAFYAGGAGVIAVLGLLLVTFHGLRRDELVADATFMPALRAAILYALYGAGSLALAARWRRIEPIGLGLCLLAVAPVWALRWHPETRSIGPLWAALLAGEGLLAAALGAVLVRWSRWVDGAASLAELYRRPLLRVAEGTAIAAAIVGVAVTWVRAATIDHNVWLPLATVSFVATYFLLAWQKRSAERTWVASLALLLGLIHALVVNFATEGIEQPWLVALLGHATFALAGALGADVVRRRLPVPKVSRAGRPLRDEIADLFVTPLELSALLSSAISIPALVLSGWTGLGALSACVFWLAALWLVIAVRRANPALFAAHQVALTLAVALATAAWVERREWFANAPRDFFAPQALHAFGVALGLLSLAWIGARLGMRGEGRGARDEGRGARGEGRGAWDEVLGSLGTLLAIRPSVDWFVRHALIATTLVISALFLLPSIYAEVASGVTVGVKHAALVQTAYDGGYILLVAVLAAVLVAALWQRFGRTEVAGAVLVAAMPPCAIAAHAAGQVAAGSALRWSLAIGFLLVGAIIWARRPVAAFCRAARMRLEAGSDAARIARLVLLVTAAAPVVAITLQAAWTQLAGRSLGGPAVGSLFERLGPAASYLIPLLLVIGGLVGFALRERSALYAFGGGLVAELATVLGYALYVTLVAKTGFRANELVTVVQLATIAAAVWAIGWLVARLYVDVWREPAPLMDVQIAFGWLGNALLLGAGFVPLALVGGQPLTRAVGSPLGWQALVLAAGAAIYRRVQIGDRLRPHAIGLLGLAAMAMVAFSVERYSEGWGYRTLMIGWASYALLIVAASWWAVTLRALPGGQGPPQAILRMSATWVRVAGLLAVALGLKAAVFHASWDELLWAAAAIAIASLAGATMAVWRRQEGWAFAAALGVNLAASLVVWYGHQRAEGFGEWWLRLVQANVIASSAAALAWLAVRRRLYQMRELNLRQSPLLALQTALPVVGNAAMLIAPVGSLIVQPTHLPDEMARLAAPAGWFALGSTAVAAGWYLWQSYLRQMVHVVAGVLVGVGVLATCLVDHLYTSGGEGAWLGYHTLTSSWAAAALLVLAVGWAMREFGEWIVADRLARPSTAGQARLEATAIENWVVVIGIAAAMLAGLYAWKDTEGVWWNLGAIAAVSLACGTLAMWLRAPAYVYLSGVLLVAASTVAWLGWGTMALPSAVQYHIIGLAAASIAWSLARWLHPDGVPHPTVDSRPLAFSSLAAQLAVAAVGMLIVYRLGHMLLGHGPIEATRLSWIVLGTTAIAIGLLLWERASQFALPGAYFLTLAAIVTQVTSKPADPVFFCWKSVCTFAGFVIVAALAGWALPKAPRLWQALHVDDERRGWRREWFQASQALLGLVVAALAAWIAIDFRFDGMGEGMALFGMTGRVAGVFAALMLLGATVLMAWQSSGPWRESWQYAAMAAGALLTSTYGWARLSSSPDALAAAAPWLHRCVLLMTSSAMMTLMSGLGLTKAFKGSDWATSGRRAMPAFAVLALGTLVAVLGQELWWFQWPTALASPVGAPVALWAVIIVAVALIGLAVGAVGTAVVPSLDPLALSLRGRTAYVYLAEGLLALVGLHVWLTMPWLFSQGLVRHYWMLIVMAVAFGGAGLGEFFARRRMPVLAEPLGVTAMFLPAVPAIGFWLMPATARDTLFLGDQSPVMWLLVGAFYGVLAVRQGSLTLAALSLLTANTGLWVLWHRVGWHFLDRPQLWLIPIAMAALVAEHLDRRRLSDGQRTAIRYLALSVIYLSSTTEFWRAIGQSVVLPLVTVGLAVIGILAGVMLRVRSFLYLGVTFLAIVIGRMIFFAAFEEGHMWLFWSCCIALGAAIIALFAVFEKRRNDILAAVERFKQWQE